MKTWLHDLLDALMFRGATLIRVAQRPDAFWRGLTVILAVALFAGLPALVTDLARGFQPAAVVEPSELQPDLTRSFEMARPWLRSAGVPDSVAGQILQMAEGNALMGGTIAAQIQQLPTALPRPLAQAFMAIGRWLSRPFANSPFPLALAALSTWLGYGIWVMLAAKLLGGTATLHGFFGATAFFAVPHVLNILGLVPVAGPLIAAVAFLWGLVIYIAATGATHRLSAGRAIVAVFAPFVLLLVLLALVALSFTIFALAAGLNAR